MLLKRSVAYTRVFALTAISLAVTIKLSKNGAALANPAAGASTLTELSMGVYKFDLAAGDTDTLGCLAYGLVDVATGLVVYSNPALVDQVMLDIPGGTVTSVTNRVTANSDQIGGSTTAASNLAASSAGMETGTAQAGGAAAITLRAGASAVDQFYKNQAIMLMSGTGAPQTNRITAYNGTTKVATVQTPWATAPDATSVYIILGRVE